MSKASRTEAGATLIELIIAMAILGFVLVALTSAMFVGIRTTSDTHTRLDQSNAEQLIATHVTKDVQGADAVTTSGVSTCGSQPVVLGTTSRSDATLSSSNITVAYRLSGTDLVRQSCGATASTQTIAHGVTAFAVSGTDPSWTVSVTTAASDSVSPYSFTFEVRRRQG